jgi:hypothetical protein
MTALTPMRRQGVTVEVVRAIDRDIATGVWPDMTEHGCGEAGPGPSYLSPGGIPAHGNQRSAWDAGCLVDFDNPEHR